MFFKKSVAYVCICLRYGLVCIDHDLVFLAKGCLQSSQELFSLTDKGSSSHNAAEITSGTVNGPHEAINDNTQNLYG